MLLSTRHLCDFPEQPLAHGVTTRLGNAGMNFITRQSGHGTFAVDALIALVLVILPLFAMIALLFLLSSADPTTAVPGAVDGAGMLILPP